MSLTAEETKEDGLQPELLMEWSVDVLKKPKHLDKPSPRLDKDAYYRVFRYREYSLRIKCFICNTREKAGRTVAIRNESTLEEFNAGLDCLHKHFGVTREQLKDQVSSLRILIKYWLAFVGPEVARPIVYRTSDVALTSMADFIGDAASFECHALDEAKVLLGKLRREMELVNEGYKQDDIYALQTLIALQYAHRYAPEGFAAQETSLLNHPMIQPDEKRFVQDFFESLSRITLSDITQLRATVQRVSHRGLPITLSGLPPYNYRDQSEYLGALKQTMTYRAIAVDDTQRRYHDTKGRSRRDAIENSFKEVRKKGWITLSFGDVDKDDLVLFDLPQSLQQQLKRDGILYYLSPSTKPYERSLVALDTDALTRKRRKASEEERNEPLRGFFRGLVLWRPDPWYDAYGIWSNYGGARGMLLLENLHGFIDNRD